MNNKISFSIIVFLFFTFPTLFGQGSINYCELLESILTISHLPRTYNFAVYDTIYIYEEDTIKHFTNCDFSQIETNKIVIIPNNIPLLYDTIYGKFPTRYFDIFDSVYVDVANVKNNVVLIFYDTIYGEVPKYFPDFDFPDFGIIRERHIISTQDTSFFLIQRNLVLAVLTVKEKGEIIEVFFALGRERKGVLLPFPKMPIGVVCLKKRVEYVPIDYYNY